jgi:hypothetical protein
MVEQGRPAISRVVVRTLSLSGAILGILLRGGCAGSDLASKPNDGIRFKWPNSTTGISFSRVLR